MSKAFVWFHNRSRKPKDCVTFYGELFGWKAADGPGMTMFADAAGPFAGLGDEEGEIGGWLPYVEVTDVDASTKKAKRLGAEVIEARAKGPAGDYVVIRDPGGATLALWQKA